MLFDYPMALILGHQTILNIQIKHTTYFNFTKMKISSTIIFLFFASAISAQTGNIGVNTTTPQKTLHVNGSLQVTNEINVGGNSSTAGSAGTAGQVLTSGGAGTAPTWATVPGAGSTTNTLTNTTNTITSTVNGLVATAPAVNTVANTTVLTGNNNSLVTTVNGVASTSVNVPNLYTANGTLTANRTVTQGANTLAFTSTATNGFSVDGTTFSVDAANHEVGIGTAAPNTNAVLDLTSTTKGLLIPRLTLSALNSASPLSANVAGMEVYNTATNTATSGQEVYPGEYVNNGTTWGRTLNSGDVNVIAGADGTDAIATTSTITVPAAGAVNTAIYTNTFTLTKPSLVTFSASVSFRMLSNTTDTTVSKLYRSFWEFTSLPAGSTLATATPSGPSSALYFGATNATSGIFELNPSVTLRLIAGTYTVQLTGRAAEPTSGTGFTANFGAGSNDNVSITAVPIK